MTARPVTDPTGHPLRTVVPTPATTRGLLPGDLVAEPGGAWTMHHPDVDTFTCARGGVPVGSRPHRPLHPRAVVSRIAADSIPDRPWEV